jgi:hypothetical protein
MHGRGPNPASRHRRPTPAICAPWFRGGSDYDFAPLFDSINVAGADLALCHAPRTLERVIAEVRGVKIALGRGIEPIPPRLPPG